MRISLVFVVIAYVIALAAAAALPTKIETSFEAAPSSTAAPVAPVSEIETSSAAAPSSTAAPVAPVSEVETSFVEPPSTATVAPVAEIETSSAAAPSSTVASASVAGAPSWAEIYNQWKDDIDFISRLGFSIGNLEFAENDESAATAVPTSETEASSQEEIGVLSPSEWSHLSMAFLNCERLPALVPLYDEQFQKYINGTVVNDICTSLKQLPNKLTYDHERSINALYIQWKDDIEIVSSLGFDKDNLQIIENNNIIFIETYEQSMRLIQNLKYESVLSAKKIVFMKGSFIPSTFELARESDVLRDFVRYLDKFQMGAV